MARRFASFVHVFNEDDGSYHVFGPDDDVPAWAAKNVGDHVWASDGDSGEAAGDDEPPRSGKGSGKGAWSDYAAEKGVEVDPNDDRDAIIAKLADAGVVSA